MRSNCNLKTRKSSKISRYVDKIDIDEFATYMFSSDDKMEIRPVPDDALSLEQKRLFRHLGLQEVDG
jgi:hypothetical protein